MASTVAAPQPAEARPAGRSDASARVNLVLERGLAWVEHGRRWALASMMLVDAVLLLHLGRGLTFFFDEWDYVTHDYGGGLHSLLQAHNGHMSLFPVAIYKILFHLVGLNHYAVFRFVLIALHLTCVGLVYVLASRRLRPAAALLAAALILFLGAAWENLLWAFQIDFMLSMAGGLAAWVMLERRDRLGDIAASVAVLVAVGSSGLGIPVLVGVAVELVWRGEWRRGFVVVVPAIVYGLWYLGYGEDELTRNGLINSPGFAEDISAAAFGGLAGRGLDWGRPLALLGVVVLLGQLARSAVTARLAGLLVTGAALWWLTAAARSTISSPETSRYVYLGAVVIVLVGVELLREHVWDARAIALSSAIVGLSAIAGMTLLHNGALGLRTTSHTVAAELGALELAASHAPGGYQPDPQRAPQISAGPYLHTVRAIGSSPGDTPQQIAKADTASRAAADAVLMALEAPGLRLGEATSAPRAISALPVLAVSAGKASQRRGCVQLAPTHGAALTAELAAPAGGARIADLGSAPASVMVRRFGDAFIAVGSVPPRSRVSLTLPTDGAAPPWRVQLSSPASLLVCG